jgi:hypothetical protein
MNLSLLAPRDAPQLASQSKGQSMRKSTRRVMLAIAWTAILASAAPLAVAGNSSIAAAEDQICAVRLTVEVSLGVPRASDDGFLSSLLSNHFAYRLDFLQQNGFSVIEVELIGPGPSYRCERVIESMRKDARVESIRVESI